MFDEAFKYTQMRYKISPDAFSTKWIGIILLSKGNHQEAKNYLEESTAYDSNDEQVWYNLAGAYSQLKNYQAALEKVNKALEINPTYHVAKNLKQQLEKALKEN